MSCATRRARSLPTHRACLIFSLVLSAPTRLPMGHVSNRLYSTASRVAVSAAHLNQFPPREAVVRQAGNVVFDPQSWAALQPPPPSALTAFTHRIGLGSIVDSPDTIRRACTHKSFVNLHAKYYPSSPAPLTNAGLAALGNSLLGLFVAEYLHASYPHLPTRVLKAAVSAHVGPLTCASVAQEMGATPLLRWHRQVSCIGSCPKFIPLTTFLPSRLRHPRLHSCTLTRSRRYRVH